MGIYQNVTDTAEPRIYVVCLAAYNAGRLHGEWIDATQDIEQIQDDINAILQSSPVEGAEEWAIHDYEGFGCVSISEYEGIQSVHDIANFLTEYTEFGAALLDYWCGDIEDAKKAAEDSYHGLYDSVADYAQIIIEDTTEVPEHLQYYIDYERLGRDMESNGEIYTLELSYQNVHIFCAH